MIVLLCVNDIACAGAEPLFFLDYIACGKNEPEKIASIVKGVERLQAGWSCLIVERLLRCLVFTLLMNTIWQVLLLEL